MLGTNLGDGAGGGGRTHTKSELRQILSLVRLPVPPLQPACGKHHYSNRQVVLANEHKQHNANAQNAGGDPEVRVRENRFQHQEMEGNSSLRSRSALNSQPIRAIQASKYSQIIRTITAPTLP